MRFDVAVIGGGIAGVSAAIAAQLHGAQSCLIRGAPGATALSSGAWNGPLRAELRDGLAKGGLALSGTSDSLVHERGQLVAAEFCGATHAGATAAPDTVVCGFAGLPHFNAQTLARLWHREAPLAARTIVLETTPAAGWTTSSLAAYLESQPDVLLSHLRGLSSSRVIFPAVLGITRSRDVTERLAADGINAAEALAASPSLPGWRLHNAAENMLRSHGVTTLSGRALLDKRDGSRVLSLRVGDDVIQAGSFVLATGKYLAGGITTHDEFGEAVFDLPVWLEQLGDVFTAPDALPLTDPVRTSRQSLLYAGVHTNEQQCPVDRADAVVFQNLFVAGTVRAGWATAATSLGVCAEDGWRAGVWASA